MKKSLYNARAMVEKNDSQDDVEMVHDDDILPQDIDIDEESDEATTKDKLQALRKKLHASEEERKKCLEDLQRTRADFLNSKRRLEEQLDRDKARATDKILVDLLTLVDSFDTAMADKALWGSIDERWRVGVEAIHTKLLSTLRQHNVVPEDPIGQHFNPEEHEAVSNVHVEDESQVDTIIAVLQKGFKRNETIIRPAKVVVGTME